MRRQIVRRIQTLALICIGDDGDRSVVLVADDATRRVLARELAALMIERVAVAVVRRRPEHGDPPVVFQIAHLAVVGNIAPHQVATLARPRRPLAPEPAGPQPLNRRVAEPQRVEPRIDREDIGIRVADRRGTGREISRRTRNYCGRSSPRRSLSGLLCPSAARDEYGNAGGRANLRNHIAT